MLVVVDLLAIVLSFLLAYFVRLWLGELSPALIRLERGLPYYAQFWPVLGVWPVVFWREGLYPGLWLPSSEELKRLAQGTTVAGLIVLTLTFITQTGQQFSRTISVGWWLSSLFLLPLGRYAARAAMGRVRFRGSPAVLVGAGSAGRLVVGRLDRQRVPVLDIVAAFDDDPEKHGGSLDGIPIVGAISEASEWAGERGVRAVAVAMPSLGSDRLMSLLESLSANFHRVVLVPDLSGLSTAETMARDLGGVHTVELRRNLLLRRNRYLKRAMDLIIAAVSAGVLAPVGLAIAAAIALEDGRPLLYVHGRLGLNRARFSAFKFRTMVKDADRVLNEHLNSEPAARAEWNESHKLRDDPRVTRVGRWLRRFSLDELPQLWNVIKGDMSLVGPRPIVAAEIPKYGELFSLYQQVRPGLTGLWQVSGRSEIEYEERVQLDAYYVRNWTVWLDLVIIARTFWAVLSGRGAY